MFKEIKYSYKRDNFLLSLANEVGYERKEVHSPNLFSDFNNDFSISLNWFEEIAIFVNGTLWHQMDESIL